MKRLAYTLAALLPLASVAVAADASRLEQAARTLGVDAIQSLEFEAYGNYYQFGQAPAPELPWPLFRVSGYVATLDFERGAIHAKYHREQEQEPGRARPPSVQDVDQYAVNGITWNLSPAPTAIPANLAERNAELWAWSPQGFIKAALAHHATIRPHDHGEQLVEFSIGPNRYEGHLDENGDLRFAASWMDNPVLGDTRIEFYYDEYKDLGGVRYPTFLRRAVAGKVWYELWVTAVRLNVAKPFTAPAEIAANPVPSVARIDVTQIAPGVLLFGGGTHNSVIVEQAKGIVVIEAPLNEQRSEAVIARVRELFPGKQITAVINTHAHFDHAGGLRTYAAEGIPVITLARNAGYYSAAWSEPHTLNPDRLANSKRNPVFREFTGKLTLDDATHPIDVHEMVGSGHNDAIAMVYLPRDRVLVEADVWTPAAPGTVPLPNGNPLWKNLYENIGRLKLDVVQIAPLHGSLQTLDGLRAAIAASATLRRN